MTEPAMSTYVVYDHPADFPDHFVVRRWDIIRGASEPQPQEPTLVQTLDEARAVVERLAPGSVRLERSPEDVPTIVEVWL